MKKQMSQGIKQRVGKLIEQFICDKYSLQFNKRQQTKGYYDAYNNDNIYEIKAIKAINNQDIRIIIFLKNHKELLRTECGNYIIVNYTLKNKDRDLQLIQDIDIQKITVIVAQQMTNLISEHGAFFNRNYKGHIKEYVRLKYSYINDINFISL